MQKSIILEKYEDYLMDQSKQFVLEGTEEEKKNDALTVLRYAMDLLGWTPQIAADCLTSEILEALKLTRVVNTYIPCPNDVDFDSDLTYLVHLMYPRQVEYDASKQVKQLYMRVKNRELERFPKQTFKGSMGTFRTSVLLYEFINSNIASASIPELYERFADHGKINSKLKKEQLYNAYRDLYRTPLDFLHKSLDPEYKDTFLFNFYSFSAAFKACARDMANGIAENEVKIPDKMKKKGKRTNTADNESAIGA